MEQLILRRGAGIALGVPKKTFEKKKKKKN